MVGGIQSAVFAVFMEHKLEDWLIGFGLKFWCIVYTGQSSFSYGAPKKKGPVFVTMFSPLVTVMDSWWPS
ncbi:unnamed protein product [Urochloa humidicola]